MEISEQLISLNKMSRPGLKLNGVKEIIMHYVGNTNTAASANRNYFNNLKNQERVYASSHYIVGLEGEVIRCIPEHEVAYHSGNYEVNLNSLSIETCHINDAGQYSDATYNSMVLLCRDICKRHDLDPLKNIRRHFDVTGKRCPRYFVDNVEAWEKFKNDVANIKKEETSEKYFVTPRIGLNIRTGPGVNFPKVGALTYNTLVDVYSVENGFGKIANGYVSMDYLSKRSKYVVTATAGLNIRKGPGVNYDKIGALKYNTTVDVIGMESGFAKISSGYVSAQYIKKI
ncbi:MAG: N-acetylmuramoyl-L-alanine amidase [Clostridia bacterium]